MHCKSRTRVVLFEIGYQLKSLKAVQDKSFLGIPAMCQVTVNKAVGNRYSFKCI